MKKLPALIAALVTTVVIAVGMLAIGVNAFFNPNSVVAAAAPADQVDPQPVSAGAASDQALIQQLQERINQYQQREQQYQSQLDEAGQRLEQANTQVQQYQNLLAQLQQMGVIQVNEDGDIFVPRFRGEGFEDGEHE